MHEAVDEGGGGRGGRHDGGPLGKGQGGGDDDGAAGVVAFADDVVEQVEALDVDALVGEAVKAKQVRAQVVTEAGAESAGGAGGGEVVHGGHGVDEEGTMAGGEGGPDEGFGEVGLAEAAGGKEQDGAALLEESKREDLVDERAVDAGGVLEVEVREGSGVTEVTLLVAATEGVSAAALDLGLGKALEQRFVGKGFADALSDDFVDGLL